MSKFDKILGEYRESDVGRIPQRSTDPTSPQAEDAWVLKQQSAGTGGGIIQAFLGLGFPMLSPGVGSSTTYSFSFRTKEGTTKRATLS